jgi:cobalt-zinc-cadmium efflux system outer membrane protein
MPLPTVTTVLTLLTMAAPDAAPSVPADAPDLFDEQALAGQVWAHAPDVLAARRGEIEASAVSNRSYLLPNPTLTGTWGTIPIGERNPPGDSFWAVPNYTLGVGELVELGKRGPRQRAAEAGRRAARFDVLEAYRQTFFAVLEALADQAAAQARVATLERLVVDSEGILRLQRARADRGDVAVIEVDRLEVEHARLQASLQQAQAAREAAATVCAQILGAACPRFESAEAAQRYLDRDVATARPPVGAAAEAVVSERPDLQALRAQSEQSSHEAVLAKRQAIPDPIVGVSYTRDAHVAAGNQANSLTVSVTVPLPVFDRGQVDRQRAEARRENAEATRQTLTTAATTSLAIGRQRLELLRSRARLLDEDALPRARSVAERIEQAARRGGAALPDVLLARRALEELQLDRLDVTVEAQRVALELRRTAGEVPTPAGSPPLLRPASGTTSR